MRRAGRKHRLSRILSEADRKARARVNRRMGRRQRMHAVAALPARMGSAEWGQFAGEDEEGLTLPARLVRIFCGLLLLPVCVVLTVALFQNVAEGGFIRDFWRTSSFFYFGLGVMISAGWLVSGLLRPGFLYLYVLGHELTHALFIWLFLGRISSIKISLEGGHVVTNRSNILISLSPYFVPFWSVVALLLMAFWRGAEVLGWLEASPLRETVLFFLLGTTWSFHFLWTVWMIPKDQPDLKENDTFFSLVLIYLMNVLLLSALLCLGSSELGWRDFVYYWVNLFLDLFWDRKFELF